MPESPARTLTGEVVDFITNTQYEDLPAEVIRLSKQMLIDGTAVMFSGSTEESFHIIAGYLKAMGGAAEASVVGGGYLAPAPLAALANGLAGHAADYDDTQLSSAPSRVYGLLTHPTTPCLGAVYPVAEMLDVSGRDLLLAFAIGIEVECKIAEAIDPRHYQQGFHSTGTIGVFAACAAAAKLMGLNAEQTRHAIGIAASESAGLRANFGTMTKPYHAGRASENGVRAAQLASLGFEADPNILDGPWGFFQVAGGGVDDEYLRGKLGAPWSVVTPGVSIKPYPCGSLGHPSMDAMLDLVLEHDVQPEAIRQIRLATNRMVLEPLRYLEPVNALQAKFSIPFALGILALERKAGIQHYTDAVVHRPDVRAMMAKVKPYRDEAIEALGFDLIRSRVEIELTGGTLLQKDASISRGTPQRPFTPAELREKFLDCSAHVLTVGEADSIIATLRSMETLAAVRQFIRRDLGRVPQ